MLSNAQKSLTYVIKFSNSIPSKTVLLMNSLQVYWNYIVHMLTNLGPLPLERIHSMLGMFGLQGNIKKPMGLSDLKTFLQEKTVEQKLVFNNGSFSLVQ